MDNLIKEVKRMETIFLYQGKGMKSGVTLDKYTREVLKEVKGEHLSMEEKIVSTNKGLLCSWFLGKLTRLKRLERYND